ncbi:MAG: hypothetical protein PHU06_06750 [Gallionella sp.]|nr:hypothetical protein [Gallionella sp.]
MCEDTEEPIDEPVPFKIFNGFRLIDVHLQDRKAIESYVQGNASSAEVRDNVCYQDCLFSDWFHGAEEKVPEHLPLFDRLCKNCDEFYETVMQAALLKKMGDETSAKAILGEDSRYAKSSAHFQESVLTLHDKLHQQYRQVESDVDALSLQPNFQTLS